MMILPREDTPLLLVVTSSTASSLARQEELDENNNNNNNNNSNNNKNFRSFFHGSNSNRLSHGIQVLTVIALVIFAPFAWLRGARLQQEQAATTTTTTVATPMMKGQVWRGGSAASSSSFSSTSSSSSSLPSHIIDEQLMQWDEWKHQITLDIMALTKADLMTNDDSTTTTTTTTTTATASPPSVSNSTDPPPPPLPPTHPTAWETWWSNATELEREWWHKTTEVLRDWEHKFTNHSHNKPIVNHTQDVTEQSEHQHESSKHQHHHPNATTTQTSSTTTTTAATTSLTAATTSAWISPYSNLESSFREDTEDDRDNKLLYMNTSRAYALLSYNDNILHSQHYFAYQQGWEAQINQAYCGVASAAAVLNSLDGVAHNAKILPVDPVYAPYAFATQTNILLPSMVHGDCVNQHVIRSNATFSGILASPFGLGMYQVQALLQCYLLTDTFSTTSSTTSTSTGAATPSISIHHVIPSVSSDPTSPSALAAEQRWIDEIRRVLIHAILQPEARVLINYHRATAGQVGGGHWSPLGSYHAGRDAFLLMDVAKYKYPAVWIPTSKLIAAMATVDGCSTWNFPAAQDELSPEALHPATMDMYAQVMKQVGCQAKYRGFIIVNYAELSN